MRSSDFVRWVSICFLALGSLTSTHAAFVKVDDSDPGFLTITAGDFEGGFSVNGTLLTIGLGAASVVFAHNHPSGVAEPSRADEFLTSNLKQALALVDVKVLDHFIVGIGETVSMAERGMV